MQMLPGLSDLTVNPTLFAISQVQLNATANGKIFGHSQLYRVGENIAAATYKSNDELLFNGWYTEEKQVYDYITAKGWTEDDLYNDASVGMQARSALCLLARPKRPSHLSSCRVLASTHAVRL